MLECFENQAFMAHGNRLTFSQFQYASEMPRMDNSRSIRKWPINPWFNNFPKPHVTHKIEKLSIYVRACGRFTDTVKYWDFVVASFLLPTIMTSVANKDEKIPTAVEKRFALSFPCLTNPVLCCV
jgi:hypothetical protein